MINGRQKIVPQKSAAPDLFSPLSRPSSESYFLPFDLHSLDIIQKMSKMDI